MIAPPDVVQTAKVDPALIQANLARGLQRETAVYLFFRLMPDPVAIAIDVIALEGGAGRTPPLDVSMSLYRASGKLQGALEAVDAIIDGDRGQAVLRAASYTRDAAEHVKTALDGVKNAAAKALIAPLMKRMEACLTALKEAMAKPDPARLLALRAALIAASLARFQTFLARATGVEAPERGGQGRARSRKPDARNPDQKSHDGMALAFAELARQVNGESAGSPQVLASGADVPESGRRGGSVRNIVDLAFTPSGLCAAGVHPGTVDSFPEAYRQGMAKRAWLLGDRDACAPEGWDGALGDRCVHGLMTFSIYPLDHGTARREAMRKDAAAFNAGDAATEELLTAALTALGLQPMHVEYGESPYFERPVPDGPPEVDVPRGRIEHFGFRDGISQPWLEVSSDMTATAPPPGGGTPRPDGTWAPIAPGEIFLGFPDEDAVIAQQPLHQGLRDGGTYLVFRKLRQDVVGFRHFLKSRRDTRAGQNRLAAHMMGRWPNGAPVTLHPDQPADYTGEDEVRINDFRYGDDPQGLVCPIGSHVRRANPRDTNGMDLVRRHRILRRGMPYGGPVLPHDSDGDGRERGLLFVSLQSRLDLQFELIQRNWIESGEFVGQAGAGRCPILGANRGTASDTAQEGGRLTPETHLPRFVDCRGGDYFFVPSIAALRDIARGECFYVPPTQIPFGPFSASIATTPRLIDPDRLARFAAEILTVKPGADGKPVHAGPPLKRVRLPPVAKSPGPEDPPFESDTVAFIGRYDDVRHALEHEDQFSVQHYADAVAGISRGGRMLVSMPPGPDRDVRLKIFHDALKDSILSDRSRLALYCRQIVAGVMARVGPEGRMDLVRDLALHLPLRVAEEFMGIVGPPGVTPLAAAVRFAQADTARIPRDWLATLPNLPADERPRATLELWARLAFTEVFANLIKVEQLTSLARRAMDEMLAHLDDLMYQARAVPSDQHRRRLIDALVAQDPADYGLTAAEHHDHARSLLAEMVVGGIFTTGGALVNVLDVAWATRLPLAVLHKVYGDTSYDTSEKRWEALTQEFLRLNARAPFLMRTATEDVTLPSGGKIAKGERVVVLLAAAGRDPVAWDDPAFPMPGRDPDRYINFGSPLNPHECWGKHMALIEIAAMLEALSRRNDLRPAAGPKGELQLAVLQPFSRLVRFRPLSAAEVAEEQQSARSRVKA